MSASDFAAKIAQEIAEWLHFFLDGVTETAKKGVDTFDNILQFQRDRESEVQSWKPQSTSSLALFRHLFTHPIIDAGDVASAAEVSRPTAYKLIERFVDHRLIIEITGAKRGKLYRFDAYLNLFQ